MVIKDAKYSKQIYFEFTTSSTTDWDNVNWNKTEKYVDKLQKRIYDAESKGDSRKVRDTQNNFSPYDRTKTEYFLNRESKTFKLR